ncbi:MAG TPA: GNAT family N-acetyltransferase [Caldilineae bacterium]|nr:GNAT family N-acetyltransferase [Caldilineae bacterium]
MDIVQRNISLVMIREHLDGIPHYDLPPGYAIRWYEPGDEEHWVAIHLKADLYNTISRERYIREFGQDPQILHERQCFLIAPSGEVIGTATAWFNEHYRGRVYGRVHWVAIVPEMQGRGLAKPLMTTVCRRLRELGHDRAYLTTSTVRIPAINLYLKFGFVPEIRSEEDLRVWRALLPYLKEPYRRLIQELHAPPD